MKNKIIDIILGVIIAILLGLVFYLFNSNKKNSDSVIVKPDTKKEELVIDSLNTVIRGYQDSIANIRSTIKYIKEVVTVEKIEEIKTLPLDSNVILLKNNLVKYGDLTVEMDTLPRVVEIPNIDTVVLMSEDNVKDVNIISAKYEEEVDINTNLEKIIEQDEGIIQSKDSIMLQKDIILCKNVEAYENNIEQLNKSLKKQKVKTGVIGGVLGTIAAVLTGILIAK